MTDFWTEVAWTVGLSHVLIVVILLHDDPSRLRRWARWLAGCIVPGSAILYAIALVAALTIAPYAEGRFIIRKVSASVPALPTTNLVVNLAADGDVYVTGTTQCTDGQSAQTWVDAAGTAQNVIQTIAADKPIWRAGGGTPYVEFDGNDYMRYAGLVLTGNACTFYAVVSPDVINAVQVCASISDGGTSDDWISFGLTTNPSNGTAYLQIDDGTAYAARSSAQVSAGSPVIIHASTDLSSRDVWIENASNGTDSNVSTYDYTISDQYTIGASYVLSSEASNLDGKVYHILIYDEVHDSSERADTIAYLKDKWGL